MCFLKKLNYHLGQFKFRVKESRLNPTSTEVHRSLLKVLDWGISDRELRLGFHYSVAAICLYLLAEL